MLIIPRTREINTISQCDSTKFDEEYLRTIKGRGFSSGYFTFPDGPVQRYLMMEDSQPLTAAWDDGLTGGITSIREFFEPFLRAPQELTFCEATPELIDILSISWQQTPDAHTDPGIIDAAEMIKSLIRRNRKFFVRLRRDSQTSFVVVDQRRIKKFYVNDSGFDENEAESRLVHELTNNHSFLSIDVYEDQEPSKAEDWSLVPKDFQEGMIKFYCSSAPHLALFLSGQEISRTPLKTSKKVIIGRDPSNELVVDNLSVSRRHAEVEYKYGQVQIRDLGSKNGTVVNGEKITAPVVLSDGTEIQVGKHTVKFIARAMIQEKKVDMAMLDKTMVVKAPVFTEEHESKKKAIITFNGKLYNVDSRQFSLGSADTASLKIPEVGVKPSHCLLDKDTSDNWWISHKGGLLAATKVNGKKVKIAQLNSGDLIQLGAAMIRFQLVEE